MSNACALPRLQRTERSANLVMLLIMFACSLVVVAPVMAFVDQELTQILHSKSFQGSMEVVNKFQWVGILMQWVISAVSILGLCLVAFQRVITLMYLCNKPLFNNIADLKSEKNAGEWFGFPGMSKEVYSGRKGMGLDALFGFAMMLLPNVKEYSDYKEGNEYKDLNADTDGVLDYMLKTAPSTIFLMLFLTIAFSGTLMKGYGMVVDGIAVAADRLVETNFEGWVKKTLNTGGGHTFTLGSDGSATGEFGEDIARELYSKVVSRLDVVDENTKLIIGRDCEQWVIDNVLGGSNDPATRIKRINEIAQTAAIEGAADTLSTQIRTDADVQAAKFSIMMNNMERMGASDGDGVGVSVALADLVANTGMAAGSENEANNLYLHLMITKSKVTQANYFAPADDDAGSGLGGNTSGNNTPNAE